MDAVVTIKGRSVKIVLEPDRNACGRISDSYQPARLQSELQRRRAESSDPSQELSKAQGRLKTYRERLDRLIDAYASGLLESTEFESRITPLRDQHDREAAAVASLRGAIVAADAATAVTSLEHLSAEVTEPLETAPEDLKRDLLQRLVKRIDVHREEVRIVDKVPATPFSSRPGSRGFLQHCLQRAAAATRLKLGKQIIPRY